MGFYPQPNDYTCGPFALKHALVTLGRIAKEKQIYTVAQPHWWAGTDEVRLARAARRWDCDLPMIRRTDPELARAALKRYVSQEIPVLLCVDAWDHWITVVRHEASRFVVLDSEAEPVLNVVTWPQLRKRWGYIDPANDNLGATLYDLHPVRPRFHVPIKAKLSVIRAQFLRRPENIELARYWDQYLEDLLEICRPRSTRPGEDLSMAEFMRRHQDGLLSRVTYWHGAIEREAVGRVLKNLRFVAETYGLVIRAASERRALTDLAILLALWAAASRGVDSMYGSETSEVVRPPRRRRRPTNG